ncbi:MAG: hypothetical protein N5P05_004532 (plasmid) [Chroococcopsis gigantea SAG 12.99]|jgi:hypothetical protein|nr:hypothetical protein [Chroococcopsis gigantea SAG 12.99]
MSKFKTILEGAGGKKSDLDESPAVPEVEILVNKDVKRLGRPKGKRSNPDYTQVTAYIGRDTHKRVKMALLENEGGDFSELVDQLLLEWLSTQNPKNLKL